MSVNVGEWIRNYNDGKYENINQSDLAGLAGWYDRFCETRELTSKTKELANIITKITNEEFLSNYRLSLKNNCHTDYPMYDHLMFLRNNDMEELNFGIAINCGYEENMYTVFSARNWYRTEYITNSADELITYINTWPNTENFLEENN